jgi:hypothetical protein
MSNQQNWISDLRRLDTLPGALSMLLPTLSKQPSDRA